MQEMSFAGIGDKKSLSVRANIRTLDLVEVVSAQFCRNINPFELIVAF